MPLPNLLTENAAIGSQWSNNYTLYNDDGTLMNITGKTFEFVVRSDPAEPQATTPVITVNSTTATTAGYITVTTSTSSVLVVVSPTATGALTQKYYYYTLWMDQGQPDATALVTGAYAASYVPAI